MSLQEERIARLSRMVNCAISSQHLSRPGESEAALQFLRSLRQAKAEETLRNHKRLHAFQAQGSKDQWELLAKTHTKQQNSEVLKLQIEEKQRRDALLHQQVFAPSVYPAIDGISQESIQQKLAQQRTQLQTELAAQIQEKAERQRKLKQEEAAEAQKLLEHARQSLQLELQQKVAFKETVNAQLKQSWARAIRTQKVKKDIERLRMMPMAAPTPLAGLRVSHRDLRKKLAELSQEQARVTAEKTALLSHLRSKSTCQYSRVGPQLSTRSYCLAPRQKLSFRSSPDRKITDI